MHQARLLRASCHHSGSGCWSWQSGCRLTHCAYCWCCRVQQLLTDVGLVLDALHNRRAPSAAHPNPASGEATPIPASAFEVGGPTLSQADPNAFAQALWAGLGRARNEGAEALAGAASGCLGASGTVSMDGSTGANSAISWGSAIDSRDPSVQQSFSTLSAASSAGLPAAAAHRGGQGSLDSSPAAAAAAAAAATDCRPQRLLSQLKIGELPFFGLPSKLLPPPPRWLHAPDGRKLQQEQQQQQAERCLAAMTVAAEWQQSSEPGPGSALSSPTTFTDGLVQRLSRGGSMDANPPGPLQQQASGPAVAAGTESAQAAVEGALRRRAKRLLPFCLSRGMPHTAAHVLRYLLEVSGVSLAALDADLTGSGDQAAQRLLLHVREEAEADAGAGLEFQGVQQEQQQQVVRLGLLARAVCSGSSQCVDLLLRAGLAVGHLWNPLQPQGKALRSHQTAAVMCARSATHNRTTERHATCCRLLLRILPCLA